MLVNVIFSHKDIVKDVILRAGRIFPFQLFSVSRVISSYLKFIYIVSGVFGFLDPRVLFPFLFEQTLFNSYVFTSDFIEASKTD